MFAEVNAGQVVLHHESVVHGSGPNNANHPRVGFSIHYVAPHVKETRFDGATAMLVRGDNVGDNWGIDPEPSTITIPPVLNPWKTPVQNSQSPQQIKLLSVDGAN